jgi:hypothetical protein
MRNTSKVLAGRRGGKRILVFWTSRHMLWKDNIKIVHKEIEFKMWIELIWLVFMSSSSEQGSEPSDSINSVEYPYQLSVNQLLMDDSAEWN